MMMEAFTREILKMAKGMALEFLHQLKLYTLVFGKMMLKTV